MLPGTITADTDDDDGDGLVVFLQGRWKAGRVVDLEVLFGLAATAEASGPPFGPLERSAPTGCEPSWPGSFAVDTVDGGFQVEGRASLALFGQTVLDGSLSAADDRFRFSGELDLFPTVAGLDVGGHVSGELTSSTFALNGAAAVSLTGSRRFPRERSRSTRGRPGSTSTGSGRTSSCWPTTRAV